MSKTYVRADLFEGNDLRLASPVGDVQSKDVVLDEDSEALIAVRETRHEVLSTRQGHVFPARRDGEAFGTEPHHQLEVLLAADRVLLDVEPCVGASDAEERRGSGLAVLLAGVEHRGEGLQKGDGERGGSGEEAHVVLELGPGDARGSHHAQQTDHSLGLRQPRGIPRQPG